MTDSSAAGSSSSSSVLPLELTLSSLQAHYQALRQLVDVLPSIGFTAEGSPHRRMRSLSRGCDVLTGYPEAVLLAGPEAGFYNALIREQDRPRVWQAVALALATGSAYGVEYRIITCSGQEKWVWERGHCKVSSPGDRPVLQGLITDMTLLKQIELALCQSEARYRCLVERSQEIISYHDAAGRIWEVSPACQRLLGYAPPDWIGQPVQQLLHPQDRPRVIRHYRRCLKYQSVQPLRFRIRHQQGDYRWFEATCCHSPTETSTDQARIWVVSRDITTQMQTEQRLMNRERFLTLLLDTVPQSLFWKDRHSRYLGCNRQFAAGMGLSSAADLVGKTDFDIPFFTPEEAQYFRDRDQLVMRHDQPDLQVPELQPLPDGRRHWISCSKVPIHDAENRVVGVLGVFEDLTERLAIERALTRREHYLSALVELQRHLLDFNGTWDNARYCAALEPLGQAAEASRVYLYECVTEPTRQSGIRLRAEWSAATVASTLTHPAVAFVSAQGDLAAWWQQLRQGQPINQTLAQFPAALQQAFGSPPSRVKSILLLPLLVKGHLSGVIGFSNCLAARLWNRSEVTLLQVAANAIAIATERYQVEVSLRQAENKYRSIFENAVEGIFQSTADGQYITVNPMLAKIYGYRSPQELMQQITDIKRQLYVDPRQRDAFVRRMLTEGAVLGFESAVYRQDGSVIWISESARTLYDDQGQLIGFEGTVEDITARKRVELELHQRDRLLHGVAQASQYLLTTPSVSEAIPKMLAVLGEAANVDRVYIYEHHPHVPSGAPAMSIRYEWTQADIPGNVHQPHWHNRRYDQDGLNRWYQAFQAGRSIRGLTQDLPGAERSLLSRDGVQSILMVPIFIDQTLWGYIGFDACRWPRVWTPGEESILVTIAASLGGALKRQQTEHKMCHQAFHDPLTELPNRVAFNQQLPIALGRASQQQTQLAVLFLDLDRFKNINDTLGHAIGDQLLIQATQRLSQVLRHQDMLARWGGDEFTLIVSPVDSLAEVETIAQRLGNSLKPPFLIENQELYITSSIGIATFPTDGRDVTTLLQHADAAMYAAKADGCNTYRFNSALNSQASRQLALEKYLHQALQRQEFKLFFQPQMDMQRGNISRIEALIRWDSPQLGWVSPQDFIPIAEDLGLITELGEWVLQEACHQLRNWHRMGFQSLGVAVNLSARQLQQATLVTTIEQVLKTLKLPPRCLELEITETAALSNLEASISTLNQLRQLGTRIVMDDFGTGYSSLSYLKRLPFQGIKIDRTFVQGIPEDVQDVAMLRAMIALGQELHLEVIAEGVETAEQMACLQALGCIHMQGYLFSPPLDVVEMVAFLRTHRPA